MAASRHHKPTLKSRLAANAENRPPTATRDERPAGSITPHPIRWDSVVESPESTSDVAAALADVSEPESNASMERAREPPTKRKSETAPKSSSSSPSPTTRTSTKRKSNPNDEQVARADGSLDARRMPSHDDVAALFAAGRARVALTRWRASPGPLARRLNSASERRR